VDKHKLVIYLDGLLILRERGGAEAAVGVGIKVGATGFVGSVNSFGADVRVIVKGRKVVG